MERSFKKLVDASRSYGIDLSQTQLDQYSVFYDEMVRVNEYMNLTGITDWDEVVTLHYIDSISLIGSLKMIDKNLIASSDGISVDDTSASADEPMSVSGLRILDLGTGAGFPGVPLAICLPDCEFVLADSLGKRIDYLNEVTKKMGLSNVTCIHSRAEDLAKDKDFRESFDLVVSRAVADTVVLSEYCIPFVKEEGFFVAYKSGEVIDEIERAKSGIGLLGGDLSEVIKFDLQGTDIARSFIVIKKVASTPDTYPRRAGVPSKKPLS